MDAATLVGSIEVAVEPRATAHTDEATAYSPLKRRYHNESVKHGIGEYARGTVHINGMESVRSVLKRSIHGTWHHVSPKHLAATSMRPPSGSTTATARKLIRDNGLSAKVVPM